MPILYRKCKYDASLFIFFLPPHPDLGDGCTHMSVSEHMTIKRGADFLSRQEQKGVSCKDSVTVVQ